MLIPYVSVCKNDIMFSYMNLFKTVLIFFSVIAAVSCGTAGGDVEVSELDTSELCRLQQADNPIRELYSMAVQNDSTVLLSTDREVLRYSFEGRRLKNLGNKGRAAGEYNMPMKVRVYGDRIFVWDAMNLKFMQYDASGSFIGESSYTSAIKDFLPSGNKIVIYTAGAREQNIIDIYDIAEGAVVKSLTKTSSVQRMFNSSGVYPMCIKDGMLYYMPCCEMDVYGFNLETGEDAGCLFHIESSSFKSGEIDDVEALLSNRKKLSGFYDEVSSVLMIMPVGNRFKVLTCEGEFYRESGIRKNDRRYYSLYEVDRKGKVMDKRCFPYDTFESRSAVDVSNGKLYFLKKTLDMAGGEESHILCVYE